jgi:hypothetical protein
MKVSSAQTPPPKVETPNHQAAIQAQQKAQALAKPATPPEAPKPAAAQQTPAHLGKHVDTSA